MADLGLALQFPIPPLDLTHQEALPGNHYGPGVHLLDRIRGPINCDAYGIYYKAQSVASGIGRTVGRTVTYDEPYAEILQVKEDILSNIQNGPYTYCTRDQGIVMFDEFPILRVSVWVAPACSVDLFWVVVF
jgi:alpha-glucuronidase